MNETGIFYCRLLKLFLVLKVVFMIVLFGFEWASLKTRENTYLRKYTVECETMNIWFGLIL